MVSKTFLIILTLILWFLFRMSSDVPFEVASVCKTFLTVLTLKGFLHSMHSDVPFNISLSTKTFLTIITLMELLFGMS